MGIDPSGRTGPTAGLARGPGWRRSSPGLYVPAAIPRTTEQTIREQAARLPPGGAVAGWAALRLHGAAYFDGRELLGTMRKVPLVVPPDRGLRPTQDSVMVRQVVPADQVVERHGMPCLVAARALVDETAAAPDLRSAVTRLDMALSARVTTHRQVVAHMVTRPGMRGATRVRQALDLSEDRVLSPQETWLRLVWVLDARLPAPRCNWPVADLDGRRLGRPDLLCDELGVAVEYDGAEHRTRARHGADVRRGADFRAAGLEVVTVVATDLPHPARVVERLLAAVDRARSAARPRGWLLASRPPPV